jgi:hypothetical protein
VNTERAVIVDEIGDLTRDLALVKPKADRLEELQKIARGWYAESPGNESFVERGARYELQIGMKGKKRRIIAMAKLFTRLGKAAFLEACTFPLEVFDRLIPAEDHKLYLTEDRSGTRPLKPVARVIEMPRKKAA